MSNVIDGTTITTYRGDTVIIPLKDIPTDKNYTLYISVYDLDTHKEIFKISSQTLGQSTKDMIIPAETMKLCKVPAGESYKDFGWVVKACYEGTENTWELNGNDDMGAEYIIRVYFQRSEGDE